MKTWPKEQRSEVPVSREAVRKIIEVSEIQENLHLHLIDCSNVPLPKRFDAFHCCDCELDWQRVLHLFKRDRMFAV